MAATFDENLHFVLLIEEHKEILEKSQAPSLRKKKEDALTQFAQKWAQKSGKTLSNSALLKKINNLKQRAKSAAARNQPLSNWQSQILDITKGKDDCDDDDEVRDATQSIVTSHEEKSTLGDDVAPTTTDMLKQLETSETEPLTNQQLQRVVLLRQIKILELQQQKLELDIANAADTPVVFDISSLNVSNILNADE